MSIDSSIHDQTYAFFVMEAPDLLQSIEEHLFQLRSDRSIGNVHHLMRMTHTLKGAAASVGLNNIKEIAHSLEDVFKTLYNPEIELDAELESLLFQGYEALRDPLTAQLAGNPMDSTTVLNHASLIFTQIQDKLGSCFDQQSALPSSVELGFDLTESIFETGVLDRITMLVDAVKTGSPETVAQALQEQANIFLGLAESLSLPGFGNIAQATLTALRHHPLDVLEIANVAISDFKAARAAVLGGDRSQGGSVSPTFKKWSPVSASITPAHVGVPETAELAEFSLSDLFAVRDRVETPTDLTESDPFSEPASLQSTLSDLFNSEVALEALDQAYFSEPESPQSTLADLTNLFAPIDLPELGDSSFVIDPIPLSPADTSLPSLADLVEAVIEQPSLRAKAETYASAPTPIATPTELTDSFFKPSAQPTNTQTQPSDISPVVTPPSATRSQTAPSPTIRVETNKLKQMDEVTGEMLAQQNRQLVIDQQLDEMAQTLREQLMTHRQLLQTIRDWGDRLLIRPNSLNPGSLTQLPSGQEQDLDSIELDPYSELHVLLQSALEETVQLEESAEAIQLFRHQSHQSLDKQQRLLTEVRETLSTAQMIPIDTLFQRFLPMVKQLSSTYGKPAELHLSGTHVLMDRFLIEKLYDPILHLLRNGFDHGLESPDDRQSLGKPKTGQLFLHAYRRDRWFVITIHDDGKGIDYDKVLSRAIEKHLLQPKDAEMLSESRLLECLFEPGFSTATRLSDLSGRGIGLDVVKNQIEALQGRITIQSRPFYGTTFSLYLPYELNVAKVIICRVQSQFYAFLSESIAQIVAHSSHRVQSQTSGDRLLEWDDNESKLVLTIKTLAEQLPYPVPLVDNYHTPDSSDIYGCHKPLLVFCQGHQGVVLEVDEVLGEQELVVRPIDDLIPLPKAVIGCCVLSDGQLTLLLEGMVFFDQSHRATLSAIPSPAERNDVPARHPAPVSPPSVAIPLSSQTHSGDTDATVLVVDDSITLRQNLALTLQKAGYNVFQARDGQHAIAQLQQYRQIGLVICDVEMPRMNGFEFLSRRSQEVELAKTPVVMLTSRSGEKHRKIARDLGANGYMGKPYLDQELLDTISQFLPPRRRPQIHSFFM